MAALISFHRNIDELGDAGRYAHGWEYVDTSDVGRMAKCISTYAWSPARFSDGHRAERNFLGADFIGLDFDEGLPLAQAERLFCDAVHVIGTTKSHGREKNGITCDRFRVILKLDAPVFDMRAYKATLAHYIVKYDADAAAGSASRFFWPCREITSISADGYTQEIRPAPVLQESLAEHLGSRVVPRWIDGFLRFGAPKGARNTTCYRIGVHLTICGFSEPEILALIAGSKIDLPLEEMTRAARNGITYGRMELSCVEEEAKKVEGCH